MKVREKLKDFQWNTVAEILEKLSNRNVYSIADEVGLGKTLVVAEAILQTLIKSKQDRFVIFYIASSQELIIQNIHAISKYIESRLSEEGKEFIKVVAYQSRLTRLLLDESSHELIVRKESKNKITGFVHIVGLTPGTSFKITGKGSISERMAMAPIFAYRKYYSTQKFLAEWFYGLWNRELDYILRKLHYYNEKYGNNLKDITAKVMKDKEIRAELSKIWEFGGLGYWKNNPKEHNKQIAILRKRVIDIAIFNENTRCDFLVLDEWHKYSNSCLSEKENLNKFIKSLRNSKKSKTLLVSATPFKVEYSDIGEDGKLLGVNLTNSHFENIFKLIYGDSHSKEYKDFQDFRIEYISAVTEFVNFFGTGKEKGFYEIALAKRESYLKKLRDITVRTERPRVIPTDLEKINKLSFNPSWKNANKSLKEFLDKYQTFKDLEGVKLTRSPIQLMFMDGKEFPENYISIKGKNLREENWKMTSLKGYLSNIFEEFPFSLRHPPLWIPVNSKFSKTLIFSHFTFTPPEICRSFQFPLVAEKNKKSSGTIFGRFPLKIQKESKTENTFHWPYFYAPLFVEKYPDRKLTIKELENIIIKSDSMYEAVLLCERKLIGNDYTLIERLELRFSHLKRDNYFFNKGFGQDILESIFCNKSAFTLGKELSKIISVVFKNEIKLDSKTEKRLMEICFWFHRMFVLENSQQLYKKLKKNKDGQKPFNTKGINLDYVTWYCIQYKFHQTFKEYLTLLSFSYGEIHDVFYELYSSMALKGSTQYGKNFRPFLDGKESNKKDDEGENYSQKTLRNAFNSPFPPFMLVSTSIGQEGLDFHRYCDTIIHWTPPSSPSSLQQREGRIDRYYSKQVRKAIKENKIDEKEERLDGIHPKFTVYDGSKRLNKPNRFVLFLPFSSQAKAWNRCLKRMYYNDILIGHPDPLSIEKVLLGKLESLNDNLKDQIYLELANLFINLKPKSITYEKKISFKNLKL